MESLNIIIQFSNFQFESILERYAVIRIYRFKQNNTMKVDHTSKLEWAVFKKHCGDQ